MKIIDEHYKKLPLQKREFLAFILTGFFVVAIVGKLLMVTTGLESLLIFIIGTLFMSLMKLEYRIEDLENAQQSKIVGTKK